MTSFVDILKEKREEFGGNPKVQALAPLPKAIERWWGKQTMAGEASTCLRCSGMYRICPREFILNYWNPARGGVFPFANTMMMNVGTYCHGFLQNEVLGPAGVLRGGWQHVDFTKDENNLTEYKGHQQEPRDQYIETTVKHDHWKVTGHIDGFLDTEQLLRFIQNQLNDTPLGGAEPDEDMLLEMKVSNRHTMNGINTQDDIPPYYAQQASLYQKMSGVPKTLFWLMDRTDFSSKLIVYEGQEKWWDEAARKATIIWEAIRDETLSDSMMKCITPRDERASDCPHAQSCWFKGAKGESLNMKEYIENARKAQPTREWMDLSAWTPTLPTTDSLIKLNR